MGKLSIFFIISAIILGLMGLVEPFFFKICRYSLIAAGVTAILTFAGSLMED